MITVLTGVSLIVGALLFAVIVMPFLMMLATAEENASLKRRILKNLVYVFCVAVICTMLGFGLVILAPLSID